MAVKPYLIFSLHDRRYAIAAARITEIFLLPELIPIAEAPPDIVGLLNLHDLYVPVMHLDLRFGRQFDRCNLNDSVIVVESPSQQIGVIVHEVETVANIDDRYIQQDLDYGRERNIDSAFVRGIINLDDEMIILLDVDNLIRHPHILETLAEPENSESIAEESVKDFYDAYFPAASDRAKAILASRAANLKIASDNDRVTDVFSLAIVKLNNNYFGIDLSLVREFTKISRITAVPCCPEYIVGNMNLRGEILTLVDIRQPLNLTSNNRALSTHAIVIEFNEIIAGIVVEEVIDIVDFRPEELKPVPVATDSNTAAYLKGIVDYLDRSLNAIDLEKLLAAGVLTVELAA